MEKVSAALLVCFIFTGCLSSNTVKNLHDYDEVTYKINSLEGRVVLGTVKVAALDFSWRQYDSKDRIIIQLMDRLEQKALKKYGENIDITTITIGNTNTTSTASLWLAGLTLSITSSAAANYFVQNDAAHYTFLGTGFAGLLVFLFKGIEAAGVVIQSDIPYKPGSYKLITDAQID